MLTVSAVLASAALLSGPAPYPRWATQAQVPLPAKSVSVIASGCPSVGTDGPSCAVPGGPIYMGSRDRWTFYHELGHKFDEERGPKFRAKFTAIMHYHGSWFRTTIGPDGVPTYAPDYDRSSGERFADAYANCASGWSPRGSYWAVTEYDYSPSVRQHRRVCRLIRSIHLAIAR